MARPKVVITGGAGFIGSHLADALAGDASVVVVDNMASGRRENVAAALKRGATLVRRDLRKGDLRPLFRRAQIVYHLAANPDVRLGKDGPKSHLDENVLATYRVLEACRAAKVPRIVFTSTSTVYGEAKVVPTPEDYGPLEPISLYGASKLASEALLSAYAHSFGIEAVVFRLANVIGGRSGHGVVHDLVRKLAKDPATLELLGADPGTSKSYVHVDDVVLGIRAGLLAAVEPVTVYNLGTEDAISVRGIADAITEELGLLDVRYAWSGGTGGVGGWVGDVRAMRLSVDRLKATGWSPTMTSARAVRTAAKELWSRLPAKRPRAR
jgi:UDP-glucose 4-epimerase